MTVVLELAGVCKSYGPLKVIDDLSIHLQAGEALGVVGPNGSGKTTILHLATGQLRPDAGRVLFDAKDVTGLPARARCRLGLALTAIRDSETAAEALGVNAFRVKFAVYAIAALGCGLTGAVIYLNLLRLQPDATFSVNWTAFMIFAVVIGGVGSIEGPIIGAVVFTVLQQTLSHYGVWYLIVLGLVAILIAVWDRRGIWGLLAGRFGVSLFPTRRRLQPPAGPAASAGAVPAAADLGER